MIPNEKTALISAQRYLALVVLAHLSNDVTTLTVEAMIVKLSCVISNGCICCDVSWGSNSV